MFKWLALRLNSFVSNNISTVISILLFLFLTALVTFTGTLFIDKMVFGLEIVTGLIVLTGIHVFMKLTNKLRFRTVFLILGGILTVGILILSDPDLKFVHNLPFGAGALSALIVLGSSILYIGMLHLGRKGLLDYIDLQKLYNKCLESSEGAGLFSISVGLISIAIAIVILAATK